MATSAAQLISVHSSWCIRQGGVLSPVLFAIYMDVLIAKLRNAGYGCRLLNEFYGCILYADDIMLLAHSLNAMRYMLLICEQFAVDFDIKYNSSKSVAMRTASRHSISCAPLQVAGIDLKYVTSLKYLGLCIQAASCFKCLVDHLKIKFYRVFNCIFS